MREMTVEPVFDHTSEGVEFLRTSGVLTVAGRPSETEKGKPSKFPEAAEWTGGYVEGSDDDAVSLLLLVHSLASACP